MTMFRLSFTFSPAVAGAVGAARILSAAATAASAAKAATAAALFDGARS
jgi:hypothetical protein